MSEDRIGYARLTQEALREVVRGALRVAEQGLPGDHHFYISFRTKARGVQLANYLAARYPDEMTIVLQHQYDDLEITPDTFGVTLHFGGVPQRIVVPLAAITRFYDPSVRFALPFDVVDDLSAGATEAPVRRLADAPRAPARAAPEPASAQTAAKADAGADAGTEPGADNGAAVVSLDAFRRKK
jgi:uncharacterized protein